MSTHSMENCDVSVENQIDDQQSDVNNRPIENITQNQLNSIETIEVIKRVKRTPMNPTPLYIFFFLFFSHSIII